MVLGAILAGGASSRFGSDKAMALLRNRPLIAHAHDAIAGSIARMIVCGREWGGLPAVGDLPLPGLGPLGGLAAALRYAQENGFVSVLAISCDMPEVPRELVRDLLRVSPSYCPDAPTLGHWPAACAETLAAHLASCVPAQANIQQGLQHRRAHNRAFSIRTWAQSVNATPIPSPTPLRNINRPSDLAA